MNNGWIKLHRGLLEWEWYDDVNVMRVFLHCLLKANHADRRYRGNVVKRGTFLTGRDLLSIETGLTVQQVRTSLDKLKSTNELTIKSSRQGTVIEVVNYDKYQSVTNESTNDQPTSNQQVTSNKKDKNKKNEKNKTYYSEAEGLVIPQTFLDKMVATYKKISVSSEVSKMEGWLLSNPNKRKKNYETFINNWLSRANDNVKDNNQWIL